MTSNGGERKKKKDNEEEKPKGKPDASHEAKLVRVVRTGTSEIYIAWEGETRLGQVDLHYGDDLLHATLIIEKDMNEEEQSSLLDQIDREIVSSEISQFGRDFLITIYRGSEVDSFAYGEPDIADDEFEEEY